jgi:hypothetical protein
MSLKTVKAVFMASAVYDILLGLIFGLFYKMVYNTFQTTLPNHPGYIQLVALYILIFGIGFWFVAKNPLAHVGIILLGIMMKLAFIVVVLGHLFFGSVPNFYIPFAIIDAVFLVLFVMAESTVRRTKLAV